MYFSELIQEVYMMLGGQNVNVITATSGSTITIIDSTLSENLQDDHYINWTAFVKRDALGTGAAPENEFKKVSGYTSSTRTITTAAFSVAVAAGDLILLTKPNPYPIAYVQEACNSALRSLGQITRWDTSLTTAASQTEYTLPDDVRVRPEEVWIQGITTDSNDNRYYPVTEFSVNEGAEGADWTLIIPQYDSGLKIKIKYKSTHAALVDYNDVVSESIPRPLAIAVCTWYCARWAALKDEKLRDEAALLQQNYEQERIRNPLKIETKRAPGMPNWYTDYYCDPERYEYRRCHR